MPVSNERLADIAACEGWPDDVRSIARELQTRRGQEQREREEASANFMAALERLERNTERVRKRL